MDKNITIEEILKMNEEDGIMFNINNGEITIVKE